MSNLNVDKKNAINIDMTPMVDLGFLLITFFMLSTSFSSNNIMSVVKPAKSILNSEAVKVSKTLSLILGENDIIYYFVGSEEGMKENNIIIDSTNFLPNGIRKVILQRQKEVAKKWGDKNELLVFIKAVEKSKYKNMVDILDEMKITSTEKFVICDFEKNDSLVLNKIKNL
jgi:biopolymer transport protein ExbD